jgi:hypothetical protein
VNAAVESISKYGDFEWFVSDSAEEDDPIGFNDVPPWCMPCGKEDCLSCPSFEIRTINSEGIDICKSGYECDALPF